MRKTSFAVLLFTLAVCRAYAGEDEWFLVAESNSGNDTYSIKLHSGERSQNKNGEQMTIVVGKNDDKKARKVYLHKWYVTDSDCAQEYGNLIALNMDGTYNFEASFAKGSKNISSAIAETICTLTDNEKNKANGKGI